MFRNILVLQTATLQNVLLCKFIKNELHVLIFTLGFTPFIAKLPLRDMELQEKEVQKDKIYEKSV